MNSLRFKQENSIWQLGDMRAGSKHFVNKAGGTPFFQRNQRHRTYQSLPWNDRHDATSIKQTNQAEMADTQIVKIGRRDPREVPLSP